MIRDKNIIIKNIFYMLAYAFQELRQNNYENINSEKFEHIHDLFAEILIRGISNQLKKGIHKEYIYKHETLNTLRGKLDIYGTIQHKIKCTSKLDCEYDELSENNIYNQILKTTLLILIKQDDVKLKKKKSLKQLVILSRCKRDRHKEDQVEFITLRPEYTNISVIALHLLFHCRKHSNDHRKGEISNDDIYR